MVFVCICLYFEVVMVTQTLNYDRIIHRCLSLSLFFIDESTHFSDVYVYVCYVSKQPSKLQMKYRRQGKKTWIGRYHPRLQGWKWKGRKDFKNEVRGAYRRKRRLFLSA